MSNNYCITCTNDRIWKLTELLSFLKENQEQSIKLYINPEAIDLKKIGLYEILDLFNFKSVVIFTCNPFEFHNQYTIICKNPTFFLEEAAIVDPLLHQWTKDKIFLTMYRRPTASRLGLAGHLFANHNDISHIHFSASVSADKLELYEMNKLLTYDLPSIINVGKMIPNMPLELASSQYYSKFGFMSNFDSALREYYRQILIDIVGETHVLGDTFFPTEKTTRPMWLKKPFIVFASKNYLCYLRQMGFRTFADFWSEDYDGYEGRDRFIKILQLIDSISKKSKTELNAMYWDMQYTLDHNYNLLLTQNYQNNITYIP